MKFVVLKLSLVVASLAFTAQSVAQVSAQQTNNTMGATLIVQATTGADGVVLNHTVSFTVTNNTQTQQWVSIRVQVTRSETGHTVTSASSQQVALQAGQTKTIQETVKTTHSDSGTTTNSVRGSLMSSGTEVAPALWGFVLNVVSSGGSEIPIPPE
ncbi:MAG: hypothetical protein HZA32_08290 [Opitutae bacterium]|nr:hypothetical protein [Opitutae bacterium]